MDDRDKQIEEFCSLCKMFVNPCKEEELKEEFPRIYNLTSMEVSLINMVYGTEDIILKEICAQLDIPKSTLTSAIDRLERMNYINRIISIRDRRSYGLKLTEEGCRVRDEQLAFERKLYGYLLNALDTNEERELLMQLLRKMINNI